MLAGQPPHLGGSAQAIIMKIIAEAAQLVTQLRKSVPTNVAAALDMALQKVSADRFASAAKFAEALANPAFTTRGMVRRHGRGRSRRRRAARTDVCRDRAHAALHGCVPAIQHTRLRRAAGWPVRDAAAQCRESADRDHELAVVGGAVTREVAMNILRWTRDELYERR